MSNILFWKIINWNKELRQLSMSYILSFNEMTINIFEDNIGNSRSFRVPTIKYVNLHIIQNVKA